MAIDLVKNTTSGKGAPRIGLPKMPPPFYRFPPYVTGQGIQKKKGKGKGLLLGKNCHFNNIPILGAIL